MCSTAGRDAYTKDDEVEYNASEEECAWVDRFNSAMEKAASCSQVKTMRAVTGNSPLPDTSPLLYAQYEAVIDRLEKDSFYHVWEQCQWTGVSLLLIICCSRLIRCDASHRIQSVDGLNHVGSAMSSSVPVIGLMDPLSQD